MSLAKFHKKTIGLCGQNYSGKKLISSFFKEMYRIPSFDADLAFKYIINYDIEVRTKIETYFGKMSLIGDYINPSFFDTPKKMMRLIEISEEKVFNKFFKWKKKQKSEFVIFRCTILHGVFNPVNFHKTISVYSPKSISEWRMGLVGSGVYKKKYTKIEEYPFEYLEKNSDYIINNDLNGVTITTQVKDIFKELNNIK